MVEVRLSSQQTTWTIPVLYGVILIIVGIVLAAFKADALKTIIMIVGILILIAGIFGTLVAVKETASLPILSLLAIIIGLLLIIVPNFVADVLMVILGVALILGGLLLVMNGVSAIKAGTFVAVLPIIAGVLLLAVGVLAILNLDATKNFIMILVGAVTAIAGLLFVLKGLKVRNVDVVVDE